MPGTNTLTFVNVGRKKFYTIGPGPNILKLSCPLFTNFRNKLAYGPGKPFQPSLMFVGKAGACLSEVAFSCSSLGEAPGLVHKH